MVIGIILFASSLPACFAITRAHREGYSGFLPFLVWAVESLGGWFMFQGRRLRRFAEAWEESR